MSPGADRTGMVGVGDVEQPDGVVRAPRDRQLAAPGERHAVDVAREATEPRREARAALVGDVVEVVVEVDVVIGARRGEEMTARAVGEAEHHRGRPPKGREGHGTGGIRHAPAVDRPAVVARREDAAVGAEGDLLDERGVPGKRRPDRPRRPRTGDVEQLDPRLRVGHGEKAPVRAEGRRARDRPEARRRGQRCGEVRRRRVREAPELDVPRAPAAHGGDEARAGLGGLEEVHPARRPHHGRQRQGPEADRPGAAHALWRRWRTGRSQGAARVRRPRRSRGLGARGCASASPRPWRRGGSRGPGRFPRRGSRPALPPRARGPRSSRGAGASACCGAVRPPARCLAARCSRPRGRARGGSTEHGGSAAPPTRRRPRGGYREGAAPRLVPRRPACGLPKRAGGGDAGRLGPPPATTRGVATPRGAPRARS